MRLSTLTVPIYMCIYATVNMQHTTDATQSLLLYTPPALLFAMHAPGTSCITPGSGRCFGTLLGRDTRGQGRGLALGCPTGLRVIYKARPGSAIGAGGFMYVTQGLA